MNIKNKLDNALTYYSEQNDLLREINIYLTSRDYDVFTDMYISEEHNLSLRSSSGETSWLFYSYAGFKVGIHRAVYSKVFYVYDMGPDRELYSRSTLVADKRSGEKEIILL